MFYSPLVLKINYKHQKPIKKQITMKATVSMCSTISILESGIIANMIPGFVADCRILKRLHETVYRNHERLTRLMPLIDEAIDCGGERGQVEMFKVETEERKELIK